uniref:Uncharacterized protein n=1 Tax=viral metagenome TaxID=1070528 RepID=A0A6C0EY86_9ZZZZ
MNKNDHTIIDMIEIEEIELDEIHPVPEPKSDNTDSREIREEVLDRLTSIVFMISKYKCDNNKKYKNMLNNLVQTEFTLDKSYQMFNQLLNDIMIINCSFVYKLTKIYYEEIKDYVIFNK